MTTTFVKATRWAASLGASAALYGAIDRDTVITWSGFGLAALSRWLRSRGPSTTRIVKLRRKEDQADREAQREQDRADRQIQRISLLEQIKAQVDLGHRIDTNTERVTILDRVVNELVERVRRERCPFAVDGHAKCEVKDASPGAAAAG